MTIRGETRCHAGGIAVAALAIGLGGCERVQSVLAPSASESAQIALLAGILMLGALVILVIVLACTAIAMFGSQRLRGILGRESLVTVGGIVLPVLTLSAVLAYGLVLTGAGQSASSGGEPVRITVVGERWWWRVIYTDLAGGRFESANELRIPIDHAIEITLMSADVIHSFWVPKLAGKLDMIPGRHNVLRFTAREAGLSRGQCAEYCGGAHALMAFYVLTLQPDEFESWLARAAGPADEPQDIFARQGMALFLASGCGGCHTIRGTAATGQIGPDLTHVGSRVSLGAGILPNGAQAIADWITRNQHIKPENLMPPFAIFSATELSALSSYLAGLR